MIKSKEPTRFHLVLMFIAAMALAYLLLNGGIPA